MDIVANATMKKFGYPASLVRHYDSWSVLVRPQQITIGSMVLICRENVQAFANISKIAFTELKEVTSDCTRALGNIFAPDKYNYLMLMMVDPDVHFHLLPRYEKSRIFAGRQFSDPFWPKPVDLTSPVETDLLLLSQLTETLKAEWK